MIELFREINVLYPCVPNDILEGAKVQEEALPKKLDAEKFFVSLNRYEFKKNHKLALEAFKLFISKPGNGDYKLVIAGGYDKNLLENALCYASLEAEIENEFRDRDSERILLLKSVPDEARRALLGLACCSIYTPSGEHFGIVPVESMALGTPVIAVNNGGPTESVKDGVTGSLVANTPEAFCEAMVKFKNKSRQTQIWCQERAREFSFGKLGLYMTTLPSYLALFKERLETLIEA